MKYQFFLPLVAVISTVQADYHSWKPPKPTDRRSPCPMVNALANHNFIARNGLNISLTDFETALSEAVNLDKAATDLVATVALTTSTTGRNDTLNLDDISKHGVIEHDGSLSRADIYFGDNHSFNCSIWNFTKSHFTSSVIDVQTAAQARAATLKRAAATNPEFNLTAAAARFSLIESALYLSVFGDAVDGNAVTKHVQVFFEQERLPYAEGWKRPNTTLTAASLIGLVGKLAAVQVS
ncbi:Chloroperoxidase [Bisporella sp. PMI_857]|nr:Chloroperoxidase [Bisporella sp. PMI_857]